MRLCVWARIAAIMRAHFRAPPPEVVNSRLLLSSLPIYQLSVLNMAITEFATSGGLDFEAQIAGRQSEGLATAFAPLYSRVYRRKGSTRGQFGRGGGVTVILYPVRCIARSGRRNVLAMLSIIDVCSRGLSSVDSYVRSVANWFWLGTSKTHLITHSNHIQL